MGEDVCGEWFCNFHSDKTERHRFVKPRPNGTQASVCLNQELGGYPVIDAINSSHSPCRQRLSCHNYVSMMVLKSPKTMVFTDKEVSSTFFKLPHLPVWALSKTMWDPVAESKPRKIW